MREWGLIIAIVAVLAGCFFFSEYSAKTIAVFAWMSFLCGLLYFGYVWWSGRHIQRSRNSRCKEINVQMHRDEVSAFSLFALLGIAGIVIAIYKHGVPTQSGGLYWLHMLFVVGSTVSFCLVRFMHTGLTNPAVHRKLVYVFMALYAMTFITGTILLQNRFQF